MQDLDEYRAGIVVHWPLKLYGYVRVVKLLLLLKRLT